MPPEAAKVEVNPKPHQYYLWHLQHGYQDEVWPKLVHYRVSSVSLGSERALTKPTFHAVL